MNIIFNNDKYEKALEDKNLTDYIKKKYSQTSRVKYIDFSDVYNADDLDYKKIDEIEKKEKNS